MKILVDCRMINMSGIGRYLKNLLLGLVKIDSNINFMLTGKLDELQNYVKNNLSFFEDRRYLILPYTSKIYTFDEQIKGSLLLKKFKKEADMFFVPHYNVPLYVSGALVSTVHDLIHFKFPQYFNKLKLLFAKSILKNALLKSRRIIAVSESTARDLIDFDPSVSEKIRVVYEYASEFFNLSPNPFDIEKFKKERLLNKYILYVGNRKPHKNLGRLIKAFFNLLPYLNNYQLVIAGKVFEEIDETSKLIERLSLKKKIIEIKDCSDEELKILYYGAEALVFPSLYEGFGLPPLEAMACGTPVVVSNAASLPEVVGDAGVYIDPYDVDDIARGIYQVLTDENLRRQMREKGLARAKLFSWEKCARETLKVFEEAVEESRRLKK